MGYSFSAPGWVIPSLHHGGVFPDVSPRWVSSLLYTQVGILHVIHPGGGYSRLNIQVGIPALTPRWVFPLYPQGGYSCFIPRVVIPALSQGGYSSRFIPRWVFLPLYPQGGLFLPLFVSPGWVFPLCLYPRVVNLLLLLFPGW